MTTEPGILNSKGELPHHWSLVDRFNTFNDLEKFVYDLNELYPLDTPWQCTRSSKAREDTFGQPIPRGSYVFNRFYGSNIYYTLTPKSMKVYLLMLFDGNRELWDIMKQRQSARKEKNKTALEKVINHQMNREQH